ncbi:hypothetical protein Taro_015328 [Colocasia esculenta]|uniref:Uncharacterized protein n=1 Tax=Colocasia esculenta TaxID=4460 RepID=A0A843USV4_COLES|nr:hypothetical protein [Colocasia esculenta]
MASGDKIHPFRIIPAPLAKELGITFLQGIRIAYVTTIRNRHSETVNRALVSRNSVPVPKFHSGACVLVHRLSYPLGRTQIFVRPAIGTSREAPIQNRHFDPVAFGDFRSDAQIPFRERGRGLPMRSHKDTPSLKRVLKSLT